MDENTDVGTELISSLIKLVIAVGGTIFLFVMGVSILCL